jgi:hypothetical protein
MITRQLPRATASKSSQVGIWRSDHPQPLATLSEKEKGKGIRMQDTPTYT